MSQEELIKVVKQINYSDERTCWLVVVLKVIEDIPVVVSTQVLTESEYADEYEFPPQQD